ncbi:isoprenoid synthase domain-containing protein [Infundibulicybe gibba]|nr:isoprenoid synthase domain-containing protein [Infundibulicybe gibba]
MRRCISSRKIIGFTANLNNGCRKHSVLAQKVEQTKPAPPPPSRKNETLAQLRPDPYHILAPELSLLRGRLVNLLAAAHPDLRDIAQAYFQPSKQLRPLLVLLFSRATNGLGRDWEHRAWDAERQVASGQAAELDKPLILSDVLHEWNPNMPDHTASFESVFDLRVPSPSPIPHPPWSAPLHATPPFILPAQVRLAQIVEMIHIASVLHDTIHSDSASEAQAHLVPDGSGNKLSILGGDFLLGRASTALSRLGDDKVVELIASVISNLVEGEILQMADVPSLNSTSGPATLKEGWDVYLRHVYLKTASLLAKGARSGAILGGCVEGDIWQEIAYAYGRNLGIAHQLAEDASACDFADMKAGIARGPVLYACEEYPEMQALIQRGFSRQGDLDLAFDYVRRSSGVERTRHLALEYANKARHLLLALPDSDTKVALDVLAGRASKV